MIEQIPEKDRQVRRVGDYLKSTTEEVTPLQIWTDCGCYRASAAIHRLRHRYSWPIETRRGYIKNQFGEKVGPIAFYRLVRMS